MKSYTAILLILCFAMAIAKPVLYDLESRSESQSYKKRDFVDENNWDVTGSESSTGATDGWTDDSVDDGTTTGGSQLDDGFDATTGDSEQPATTGTGEQPATTGKFPAGATTAARALPTTAPLRVTTAAAPVGQVVKQVVKMVVDAASYTEEKFKEGINKIMGLTGDTIDILGTEQVSKRRASLKVNFAFKDLGDGAPDAATLALQLVEMVNNNDPALQNADFDILGAETSEEAVTIPGTTDSDDAGNAGSESSGKDGISGGAVAGIVIGVIVGVGLIVGVAMFLLMKKKKSKVNPA